MAAPAKEQISVNASLVQKAFALFQGGDAIGAENILTALPSDSSALHLLGVMRVHQQRVPEAADLLARSLALQPDESQARLNYGKVLGALGRHDEAIVELRRALSGTPALIDAQLALARSLRATGQMEDAIARYQTFLAARRHHFVAVLELADALLEMQRPLEAEAALQAALAASTDEKHAIELRARLARATRWTKPAEALAYTDQVLASDPSRTALDHSRPALFEELQRFDEARGAYQQLLEGEPTNAELHRGYNNLLYRLGDDAEFLASYDRAPRLRELALDKANFLLSTGRHDEAFQGFKAAATRYGDSKQTMLGMGQARLKAGEASAAVTIFWDAAARFPDQPDIRCNLASALCQLNDPHKAVAEVELALQLNPLNQFALAMQGTCWRLMGDERDETLNGYEQFIQVIDLEPPEGFPNSAAFHAALLPLLERLHPPTREYLNQSLRGGSQTSENILGQGHILLDGLRRRIADAVSAYIGRLRKSPDHPYLSRIRERFALSGSWSSRLHNCGFHINHLHPGGWISSCYYVDLPPAVDDQQQQQGWIKFGQPSFDVGLLPRRVIQPVAGRLVLFPSYMWHGTIPFLDVHTRTTIAFDVVPD